MSVKQVTLCLAQYPVVAQLGENPRVPLKQSAAQKVTNY